MRPLLLGCLRGRPGGVRAVVGTVRRPGPAARARVLLEERRVVRETVVKGLSVRTLAPGLLAVLAMAAPALTPAEGAAKAEGRAVKVTVRPGTVYIERGPAGQHVSCDFLLENG